MYTDLVSRQSDSAGHVPGEREHDGHEVGDKWFVSASFVLTQDVNLKNAENKKSGQISVFLFIY